VPADPSSPIPSGLAPLCDVDPLRPAEPPHLLASLATIVDPRKCAGRRHPLPGHGQAGGLPVHREGQPAHAPGPLRWPALASGAHAGPHPRPGARPRGDPHPQGGHGLWVRLPAHRSGPPGHPQDPQPAHPRGGTPQPSTPSPASPSPRPAPPGSPICCAGTGESRTACTTCGMSPSPRTPPRSGPGPPRRSWRPCATWPSACCAAPGRSTSPPRSAITAATPTDPWPPSASAWDATKHCQGHRALRFPVTCTHVAERPLSPGPRQAILEGRPGADDDRCRKLLGAGYPCDQPVADEGLRGPRRLTLADLDQ
jgi:hypothetical protein